MAKNKKPSGEEKPKKEKRLSYDEKFDQAIVKALLMYEETRQEVDGLREIVAAVHSGKIEMGHYDDACQKLREGMKEISEGDNFLADDSWNVLTRKTLTQHIDYAPTEVDIDPSKSGSIIPIAEETAP